MANHPILRRTIILVTAIATAALGGVCVSTSASAAGARVIRVPVDSRLFLPCANGGAGEVVHFTGTILGVSSGTTNASGGSHAISIEVEQGVKGIGETTGRHYVEHFVNLFFSTTGSGGFPLVSTQQLIYRVDSAGAGVDSLIRIRNHTTVNANGETTVTFDDTTMQCLAEAP